MFAVGRGGTEAFQRKVDEYTTAINAAVIGEWTAPVNREDSIKSRMRQLEAELAKLEARPKEPTADDPDGDVPPVVIWQKRFNVSGETYTYAAVKTDAGWFTTGQAGSFARPWDELLESIGETVDGIFLAVEHSLIADGEGNAV